MWWRKENDLGSDKIADRRALEQELWQAHRDWELAQIRLNYAIETDEIDYAVYMIEAAEKRYNMLLRKMKLAYAERMETLQASSSAKEAKPDTWKEESSWSKDG